jgi:uncharacterized oxidoreductase
MLIHSEPLINLAARIFAAVGCDAKEARCIAGHLVDANLSGHDSHGVIRIVQYVTDLKAGDGRAGCNPSVVLESDNFVIVDGDRGLATW